MNENYINYKINYGDTLYHIAAMYHTTVEELMNMNPYINPYNLLVGQIIRIAPSYTDNIPYPRLYSQPQVTMNNSISENEFELSKKMRMAWDDHVYWDRLAIISILDGLKDVDSTTSRALRTAKEISDLFRTYYGDNIGDTLNRLLTQHISIAGDFIKASKNKDNENIAKLNRDWYDNADKIADELSKINPYYDKETIRKMMHRHLDLLKEEIANRLAGKYTEDVNSSDQVVQEAMMMADYFVNGIVQQFPDMFR